MNKLNSTKAVFNAIASNAYDIEQLSYVTKINVEQVKSICESLINSGVVSIYLDGETECYSMTDKYFSYIIDMQDEHISVIAISAKGTAVDRFDYTIKKGETLQNAIDQVILPKIQTNPAYDNCVGIYLIGNTEVILTDDCIVMTNANELIVRGFNDDSKTMLFSLNGNNMLSLYGHISKTVKDVSTVTSVIKFDTVEFFGDDVYFRIFESLKLVTIKKVIEKI